MTVEPPAAFFVVSVTAIGWPAPEVAGAESAETVRSGPITIVSVRVLFVSVASTSALSASARAMTEYVPGAVPGGIGKDVEPELESLGCRAGTLRKPSG